jgi:hypothetical protein
MIGITSKIHDRKTLEFKIGYQVPEGTDYSDFEMATWIFIPEALDVNRHTYPREKFYHDMLSYMRLITPVYTLEKLALSSELPYQLLEKACQSIASQPTEQNKEEYEKEIKSYASIFKSSLRDTCKQLVVEAAEELPGHTQRMVEHIHHILDNYRSLQTTLQSKGPDASLLVYFTYGDEFLVNVTEQHLFKMLTRLKKERPTVYEEILTIVSPLLDDNKRYSLKHGYMLPQQDSADDNAQFVYHAGQLKKYIESHLYLPTHKRRNAVFLEQLVFSLAAGLSMVFATVISFAFQQTYGNFTLPFFMALVISYMFKDRIKELVRNYFANRLNSKIFEYRIDINVDDLKVGWCKEGVDHITFAKTNPKARKIRNRHSPLVIGRGTEEQVIFYRKKIHLNRESVSMMSAYPLQGINDIIRYNLSDYMHKMDNPQVPLCVNNGNGRLDMVQGSKVYYLNFVFRLRDGHNSLYRRYRVCLTSAGIHNITEIE